MQAPELQLNNGGFIVRQARLLGHYTNHICDHMVCGHVKELLLIHYVCCPFSIRLSSCIDALRFRSFIHRLSMRFTVVHSDLLKWHPNLLCSSSFLSTQPPAFLYFSLLHLNSWPPLSSKAKHPHLCPYQTKTAVAQSSTPKLFSPPLWSKSFLFSVFCICRFPWPRPHSLLLRYSFWFYCNLHTRPVQPIPAVSFFEQSFSQLTNVM